MAASFDPSIISAIPDMAGDPTAAQAKGVTIADAFDRQQLEKLHLGQEKRADSEDQQVQQILKKSDYSTPEGLAKTASEVNRVSPRASMELLKTGQQYQSGQVAAQVDQLQLLEKRQDLIVSAIDPIVAQARTMKSQGASDLDVKAFITQQMPQALQGLRGMQLPDGKPALPDDQLKMVTGIPGGYTLQTLEGWEAKSKQGAAAIKSRLDQYKADTAAKGQQTREASETEKEKHDRETEDHARRQEAIQANKAKGFDDRESEFLAAMADRSISLPAGLRSQQQIKATIDGLFLKHPDLTADEIADGIKSGKLKLTAESKGAQVAGTQIGKVALATNEIDTFGDQVLDASKALPRGTVVPWNSFKQMLETKTSDKALLRFKAKMQALNNAYEQLAGRSGMDHDKRAHINQLFDTAASDGVTDTLVQSLKEEAQGAKIAADRTIAETSGTSIPGAGGQQSPGAGAAAVPASPGATTAPASGGPSKLQPGSTYKHSSGATVEILN